MKDHVGMVRRIYAHFGMTLSADAEARMRRFLAENSADKHGGHRYTPTLAGLDTETERRRHARYQSTYGVASEE